MNPNDDKLKKVDGILDDAKQVTTIGKVIAPGKAGRVIETADKIIDESKTGVGIVGRITSMFKRKKK